MLERIRKILFGTGDLNLELSNSDKIVNAKERIDFALGLFNDLKEELVEVNEELIELIDEAQVEIAKLTSEIDSATAEVQANNALIERVEQFTK